MGEMCCCAMTKGSMEKMVNRTKNDVVLGREL